jgi:hypothetical protein
VTEPEADLTEFDQAGEIDQLRQTTVRLQRQLLAAKAKTEHLVTATFDGAKDAMLAMGPLPAIPKPKADTRKHGAEVALFHLTDWQGRKLTTSYDGEVMRRRVMQFCAKAERITTIQRADHPVREAVVAFGGDMVEGLFNFATQPFEVDATIFEQFVSVGRLEAEVVRWALSIYDRVTVVCEWGNHGRIGSKRSAVPRADNFDRMTYQLAREMVGEDPRLTWQDCPEDMQRIEVGNYRALLIHGDEVGRTGYASPTTIVQHVAKWQSGAYPWEFTDCLVGHYHNHQEFGLPNGRGSVYFTGSTESDNRYARDTMAASAIPSQRLHFIDSDGGRTASVYKIWLD